MKKKNKLSFIIIIVVIIIMQHGTGLGQNIIYQEDFGNPGTNALIEDYTGWQNQVVVYSGDGTCDVRSSSASSGYDGASGGGNIMINNDSKWFKIAGINTTAADNLKLYFGLRKSKTAENGNNLVIESSTDGENWNLMSLVDTLPTGSGTSKWFFAKVNDIPSVANLSLKFHNLGTCDFRIDDLLITDEILTSVDDIRNIKRSPVAYPNPTDGSFEILSDYPVKEVELFSLLGEKITNYSVNNSSKYRLQSLPNGIYLLRITTEAGTFVKKITKL